MSTNFEFHEKSISYALHPALSIRPQIHQSLYASRRYSKSSNSKSSECPSPSFLDPRNHQNNRIKKVTRNTAAHVGNNKIANTWCYGGRHPQCLKLHNLQKTVYQILSDVLFRCLLAHILMCYRCHKFHEQFHAAKQ